MVFKISFFKFAFHINVIITQLSDFRYVHMSVYIYESMHVSMCLKDMNIIRSSLLSISYILINIIYITFIYYFFFVILPSRTKDNRGTEKYSSCQMYDANFTEIDDWENWNSTSANVTG